MRARNHATDSPNRIHDDAVARRYGYRGGLVPGVIAYAYLTRPIVERWGRSWLERGSISARLLKPVYDGDELTAELADGGEAVLRNAEGVVCVAASAAAGPQDWVSQPPGQAREPLQGITAQLSAAEARAYLESIEETLPIYESEELGHPGWLLSLANDILIENIRPQTPWIHVESRVSNLSAAHWGETVSVQGHLADRTERRGHRFCDLELELSAAGRPLARVMHRAIYELRPPGT